MRKIAVLRQVKQAIRSPYAWPGGYPLYVRMSDGEALSVVAAKQNWRSICAATLGFDYRDDWRAAGVEINWEDSELFCVADPSVRIESLRRLNKPVIDCCFLLPTANNPPINL